MNERIIELQQQAYRFADRNTREGDNQFATVQLGKFAELIIAKCIEKCEFVSGMVAVTNNDDEISRKCEATAKSCAMMIKQHFGVE